MAVNHYNERKLIGRVDASYLIILLGKARFFYQYEKFLLLIFDKSFFFFFKYITFVAQKLFFLKVEWFSFFV